MISERLMRRGNNIMNCKLPKCGFGKQIRQKNGAIFSTVEINRGLH
jgi:hypothetical protein